MSYGDIDSHHANFSDHIAVKCVLNVNIIYCQRSATVQQKTSLLAWGKSTNEQFIAYQSVLNDKLYNSVIPYEAVLCDDRMCKAHHSEICEYHDALIMSMIDSCWETIPSTKPVDKCKTVLRWNGYAKGYFDTLLFWHNIVC